MRRLWLSATLLLWASSAAAGTQFIGYGLRSAVNGAVDQKDAFICLIPDIHNSASQDDAIGSYPSREEANSICSPAPNSVVAHNCEGGYCTSSPYCYSNWAATGRIKLLNLAYELVGRFDLIDWRSIQGTDRPRSIMAGPLDHPRCDAIIYEGDSFDIDDSIATTDPNYADLGLTQGQSAKGDAFQNGQNQYQSILAHYQIIKASGIPFLLTQGNHDPRQIFQLLATDLGYTSLPFYYDTAPHGQGFAIKFPTPGLGQMCAISMPWYASPTVTDPIAQTDNDWVLSTIGCGASLPTIVVYHDGTSSSTGRPDALYTHLAGCAGIMFNNATYNPVFMMAGGHKVVATPLSRKLFTASGTSQAGVGTGIGTTCNPTGALPTTAAYDYFSFFSNWQEVDSHGTGVNYPYGNVPSDGNGEYYTVIHIDGVAKVVEAHDWSPYFQTSLNQPEQPGLVSRMNQSFDFCARFGC